MTLNDKIEDIQVQYLFIKNWKYVDPLLNERFSGHPEQGRIYRSIYNKKTKTHRLLLDHTNEAVFVSDLKNSDETEGYTCDLVTLTKKSLLDQELHEQDLDKILGWNEIQNSDLFQPRITEQNIPQIVLQAVYPEYQMEEAERMAWITEAITNLDTINSIKVDILGEIASVCLDMDLEKHDMNDIALDEKLGMGTNVSRALDCIKRYSSNNRRTNEFRDDLLEAIYHLLTEAERRDFLDLDN